MRVLAVPLTWLAALVLLCLSVALGDGNDTVANWLPLGGGAALALTLAGLAVAAAVTARLVAFHVGRYRRGR
jgi:hypothetical protein